MKRPTARLESVETGLDKAVTITYTDARKVRVDLSDIIQNLDIFSPLDDPTEFVTAAVTDFGWSLEWDCGASIDSDRVLEMALEQSGMMENVKFRRWQETYGLSLSDAAQAIGVTRRTVSQYRSGKRPVPRTIALACKGWEAEQE
jgi:DNA-binding XRE family transcriptional regulator